MSDIRRNVERSSEFYSKSILKFDYQLADYNYASIKPFFKGDFALEIGPASGYMTKHLVNDFKTIHLLEGSSSLIQEIPDYPNVKKFNSLIEEYQTDLKYETIIMGHVLEHIADPIFALNKINNWLHPNGVFLVSVPNAKSIHRLVAVEMGLLPSIYDLNQRDLELGHYRVYDMDILKQHLTASGFTILHAGGIFLKPLSNGQIESFWDDKMIDGFYRVGKMFQEYCAEIFVVCGK
jgi:2-polyprenyl-3-methyl-5-hydroxy-6-metoxy-1,4-benzoquinol methylase